MDIKEIFDRAYSDAYEKYPFSDTQTAMSKILGKAEKMKNENVTRLDARELPTGGTAHKGSRAPLIGGIAAGIAAALGIGFFAGNAYGGGIEFTPLKEGGGAAYSAAEDIVTEAVTEDITETVPEEETAGGITAKLSAVTDSGKFNYNFAFDKMTEVTFTLDEETKKLKYKAHIEEMIFTGTQIILRYRDPALTPDNTELVNAAATAPVELEMWEGDSVFAEVTDSGFSIDGDFIVIADLPEHISISDVRNISVGLVRIWGEAIDEFIRHMTILDIRSSDLYTKADEWFSCDGYRVHITGYTFDGINLRLAYDILLDEDSGYISTDFIGAFDDERDSILPLSESIDEENVGILSGGVLHQPEETYRLSTVWNFHRYEPADEITVTLTAFPLTRGANHPQIPGEAFTFTAYVPEDADIRTIIPDNSTVPDSLGNLYPVDIIRFSEREFSAVISEIPYTDFSYEPANTVFRDLGGLDIKLVFADGSEMTLTSSYNSLGQPVASGRTFIHCALPESISPDDVTEIWFNDSRIV